MKTILVTGNERFIMDQVVAKLERHDYEVISCLTKEETLEAIYLQDFDGIIMSGRLENELINLYKEMVKKKDPHIKIIQHSGGAYKLIEDVEAAFSEK